MVGKNTVIAMAELTAKYVGKPFASCTCMDLVHRWYADLGGDMPDEFGGFDLHTYMAAWEADRKGLIAVMFELFKSLGESVEDLSRLERHDLLAVEEKGNTYAAIYLGGGMAIKSHLEYGVMVFHIGEFHRVVMARRLLCQQ